MNPTELLASYVADTQFDDFPAEVVYQAKHCILDSIGCALGGAQTELGQQYIGIARELGGKPESTVIGDGTKVSFLNATYANAILSDVLDFSDTHLYAISHPGGPIIQAGLPAGEAVAASGKDIIAAVILGYEVSLRIGRAIRSIIMGKGRRKVLFNAAFIVFGSATSVGKLLKLSQEETISAFGIAGTMAPGTARGTHRGGIATAVGEAKLTYQMHAFLGAFAACQAHKGLVGPNGILDEDTFWTKCGAISCNYLELTRDLGKTYRIMEVGFKPVCSCRFTQPSITAVWKALEGEKVKAEDIEEIILTQGDNIDSGGLIESLQLPEVNAWDTMVQAQFSLPCAVAMSIIGGQPGPDWYKTNRFKEQDVRELARKIKLVDDPEAAELWVQHGRLVCKAEVKLKDGQTKQSFIEYPKGEPENPLTEEQLQDKFIANAKGILGQKKAEELAHILLHLEDVRQIPDLSHLLCPQQ